MDPSIELQQLYSEANRLKDEIGLLPKEDDKRLDLQRSLERTRVRQAELEELERVQATKDQAIKSGFVIQPVEQVNLGECPLCQEAIPEKNHWKDDDAFGRYVCCGTVCCADCYVGPNEYCEMVMAKVAEKMSSGSNDFNWQAQMADIEHYKNCPFCRDEITNQQCEINLKKQAKAGKDWAQFAVGEEHLDGTDDGVPVNRYKAAEWFKKAADQGHIGAKSLTALLWNQGFPEIGIPRSERTAQDYWLQAARLGHPVSQFMWAKKDEENGNFDKALVWFTLAATQGYCDAQAALGMICRDGRYGVRASVHAAIYWLRQSCLQVEDESYDDTPFFLLSQCLIQAQTEIYESADVVGCSSLPEAAFWHDVGGLVRQRQGLPHQRLAIFNATKCACCGKAPATKRKKNGILRCVRCKAVGYCGKDCQTKHWKMGHNVDCGRVTKLRKAIDDPSVLP